ncbi:beta-ketoacyl synthase [Chryseobacterium sp.]|nr:beta-ketoacyl synthase [Chryseobacterium sp.]
MKPASAYITEYNIMTPLGFEVESNFNALLKGESGIKSHSFFGGRENFFASVIDDRLLNEKFEAGFGEKDFTRLEKMLLLALKPLMEKQQVSEDTLLILSTTKGNITALKDQKTPPESAYLAQLAQKIADFYGFRTKPIVVSNACVSGVLAVSVAKNLLKSGLAKDAFVIAGDEVSEFVISGFNSFQAMSGEPCRPYDANRTGISLGEAAAAVYITTDLSGKEEFKFEIAGDAAMNDANHISGPSRTGEGLFKSVQKAMAEAEVNPENLSFISAHGTATPYNDEMEAIAFSRMNLQEVPLNSMKGYYGHCLGASGLLETVISMECARQGILLPSKNFETSGISKDINIIRENTPAEITTILKTASGFGGCNAALVLKKGNL